MNERLTCNVIGELEGAFESLNRVYDIEQCAPTLNTMCGGNRQPKILETIKIKQATEQGFIEMEPGGVADLSYPNSKTRRDRVQDNGTVSPTLTARDNGIYRIEQEYRIRKLTPLECFRLMGVKDDEAKKMLAVNSNSQCYKQAGNSIVVDVMSAMFERLF